MSDGDSEKPKNILNTLVGTYIVTVLSAYNAEIFTYPLDIVKTRLQIQGERAGKLGLATPYEGMTRTMIGMARNEGIFQLWKGIGAVFLRQLVYGGTRMTVYLQMKLLWIAHNKNKEVFPLWQSVITGGVAGGFAQWVANPTDLLKVLMQMEGKRKFLGMPPRYKGMWDATMSIYKSGGIVALWKGSVPSVQRAAFVSIGDVTFYDVTKTYLVTKTNVGDNFFTHCVASFTAGVGAAVMGTPFDVLKTRIMNQPFDEKGRGTLYSGSVDCLKKTVLNEGFFALYKGFFPLWMRLGPWAIVFWLTFERIMIMGGADGF